jgi:hypothetical protein
MFASLPIDILSVSCYYMRRKVPYQYKLFYYFSAVAVDYDGTVLDLARAAGFAVVQAGIDCVFVIIGHLPEGIFDDHRGVLSIAHRSCFC